MTKTPRWFHPDDRTGNLFSFLTLAVKAFAIEYFFHTFFAVSFFCTCQTASARELSRERTWTRSVSCNDRGYNSSDWEPGREERAALTF